MCLHSVSSLSGWMLCPQDVERELMGEGGLGVGSGRLAMRLIRSRGSDMILHGENQACTPAQQLLLAGVQLALKRLF